MNELDRRPEPPRAAEDATGNAASETGDASERARLAALRRYRMLDTPPEEGFDRITTLAAEVFGVPIAMVNLIDASRQFSKSCYGIDLREIDRELSFCVHTVRRDETFVVPDARRDPTFADNPLVTGDPWIRFYAGAPLRTPDGHNVGALCLIDTEPHASFGADERRRLETLAAMVVDEFELRRANRRAVNELRRRRKAEMRLEAMVDELEKRAFTDELTGLANRGLIHDRLSQAVTFAQRRDLSVALLVIDLDGFKPINDRYGHAAGDAVLQSVARRLDAEVRRGDTVGRIGGDEFVVVCRDADVEVAVGIAERCLASLAEPVTIEADGEPLEVTVEASFGIAVYPQHAEHREELLRAADAAMYTAKESGRQMHLFDADDAERFGAEEDVDAGTGGAEPDTPETA